MSNYNDQDHPRGADGRWVAKPAGAPAATLPTPGTRFTSRNDAVEAIAGIISEADTTLNAREPAEAYDLDAIADDVLTTESEGHQYRYVLPDDETDLFWDSLARHER